MRPIPSKQKICKICGKSFEVKIPWNRLTCSYECHIENCKIISKKFRDLRVELLCIKCECKYYKRPTHPDKRLCKLCSYKKMSEDRKGNKNPGYRNGLRIGSMKKYSEGQSKHLKACAKYRKKFIEKYGYIFCEVCLLNESSVPRTEVHHIYYASLWPKHKHLHDFRNLIMLCIQCHNNFHSGKYKEMFELLEKERELKELFADHKKS